MKRPLFWKLLIGSWLALVVVSIGNGFVFHLFFRSSVPWAEQIVGRIGGFELAAAAQVLAGEGPGGVPVLAARLPPGQRLEILPGVRAAPKSTEDIFHVARVVQTPSGAYTLIYTTPLRDFFPTFPNVSRLPLALMVVDFLIVSIFSVLISIYLAGPIQRLRAGLARVGEGDLGVRVYAQVARRRDELAELARNFDVMAERLQRLLEARERLLHDVSHEFRSPLTRLLLAVELARRTPERSMASLDRIEHEAQRLNEMVGELLTLSRAEFAATRSETYFAVADLLAAVVADAAFEAEAKAVAVRADLALDDDWAGPVMNGSPELLRKGIDNVLRNAVKVSRAGQTVGVKLASLGAPPRLRIEVSDQGPGVPETDLKRIFEPFVRLDGQPQGGGFGLGLAIARSAAQAHNGVVWAANRPEGGLVVAFELPMGAATAAVEAGAALA